MNDDENPLVSIAIQFGLLSFLAIGGGLTILPEIQRVSVDVYHWTTRAQFAQLFAIAQASPGPNILFVSLIGWQAAGLAGALTATAAICGPPAVITYFVSRVWNRFPTSPIRRAIELGLAPVTVGLVLSSGYILTTTANHSIVAYAITAVTVAVILLTKLNPLWMMGGAAILGMAGAI
jgi:chromate transporter